MQDIEPFLARVRDPALRHSLAYGVGLLTETQSPAEQAVVHLLFESGAIQVSACSCRALLVRGVGQGSCVREQEFSCCKFSSEQALALLPPVSFLGRRAVFLPPNSTLTL